MIRREPDGRVSNGMSRRLSNYIIRFLLTIAYRQKGAQYNRYGSVVSPKELYIQRDQQLGIRARKFRNLLKVETIPFLSLKRFGPAGDGGYFLPENILDHASHFISCGIGSSNDFEIDLALLGFRGIQIDNSISEPPIFHSNLTFLHSTLGRGSKSVTIESLIMRYKGVENFVLKLDIEGSEYGVLENLDITYFKAIIVEFHFLHLISENVFWNRIEKILLNFNKTHCVMYINPNNYSGFSIIGGIPVPITMEVLFVAQDLLLVTNEKATGSVHPEFLEPNNPKWAQLEVSHFFPLS